MALLEHAVQRRLQRTKLLERLVSRIDTAGYVISEQKRTDSTAYLDKHHSATS